MAGCDRTTSVHLLVWGVCSNSSRESINIWQHFGPWKRVYLLHSRLPDMRSPRCSSAIFLNIPVLADPVSP